MEKEKEYILKKVVGCLEGHAKYIEEIKDAVEVYIFFIDVLYSYFFKYVM